MRMDKAQLRTVLIIMGVVLAYVGLVWYPAFAERNSLLEQIAEADEKLGVARDRSDGLAKLKQEVAKLRAEKESTNKEIPSKDEMAELLHEISVQIESENLTGQGINMLTEESGEDYDTQPLELTFSGNALDAFRLIHRLESMPRLVQIDSVTIRREHRSEGQNVNTSMRLNAYLSHTGEDKP